MIKRKGATKPTQSKPASKKKRQVKKLSNPFSTGGGGVHFESEVQASFVALMLTGGYAPCLRSRWPIVEIKLQGKVAGYDTDDLIVFMENPSSKERRRLLCQVKHSIAITKGSSLLGEVIQGAWNDYKNPSLFHKDSDAIALITGPISETDHHNVSWLLDQAKHTKDADEYFFNVQQTNFGPSKATEKLDAFKHHLKKANEGVALSDVELYEFLRHFHLIGYDLDNMHGVVSSLLHSHLSQFQLDSPLQTWAEIVQEVQVWNRHAGTITRSGLPKELVDAFSPRVATVMPQALVQPQIKPVTMLQPIADSTFISKCLLLGSWNEEFDADREIVAGFLGLPYDQCVEKAREILHLTNSPLAVKDGIWEVSDRLESLKIVGTRLLDQDLQVFHELAVKVLKELDPIFELPPEERYQAGIRGKVLAHSAELRKGIAEGLALLGNNPSEYSNCSHGKPEVTALLVVRDLLTDADWIRWGSLNRLLPSLAEAAPSEFLSAVETALRSKPCPFDELFDQETGGATGRNYLTGFLWALESLAWDENMLIRVCMILAELASSDPGGQWSNRPFNSLVTILLPWFPQTLAPFEKHIVAVKTLLDEIPEIAWNLIFQLLPGTSTTSMGSQKPQWSRVIPEADRPSPKEYRSRVLDFALLAVQAADHDAERLSELIKHLSAIPKIAVTKLLEVLQSPRLKEMKESERQPIWDALTRFTTEHRRFSNEKWALPEDTLAQLDEISTELAPTSPIFLYQPLFSNRHMELYDEKENWDEQQKKLLKRRDEAVAEIWFNRDIEAVFDFAALVELPNSVGFSLGAIADKTIDQALLPAKLNSTDKVIASLLSPFIRRRLFDSDWEWCDRIDKSTWTEPQILQFLFTLPFTKNAWQRAEAWLGEGISQYWSHVYANPYDGDSELSYAVERLLEHDRPVAAIDCIERMRHAEHPVDVELCTRALTAVAATSESLRRTDYFNVAQLIGFLQSSDSVSEEDLLRIEWAFFPLLEGDFGVTPKLLEAKLAEDPEVFCTMVQMIFKSQNEDQPAREVTENMRRSAERAWRLLHDWKTVPGMQRDGVFDASKFCDWLERVKELTSASGHLDVALLQVGKVLFYSPPDPDSLWINRAIAKALNGMDAEYLRRGFSHGTFNSRGFRIVDPTGKPERALAEENRRKAEQIENEGFQRFAITLRGIANGYDRDAERIIHEHGTE